MSRTVRSVGRDPGAPGGAGSWSRIALVAVAALLAAPMTAVAADAAESRSVYDSLYNHLIVERSGDLVTFRRMENGAVVSALDLSRPAHQIVAYNRTLFAPALVKPDPSRVLNIGLGAASFNRLFTTIFPEALLVTAEIDRMIVDVTRERTGYIEDEHDRVAVSDGRVFLRRDDRRWDWIVIDAFIRNSQIPPHLTTREFYRTVAQRLVPDGVMAMNIHAGTRLFDSLVVTIRDSFAQSVFFRVPARDNVIAVAVDYETPSLVDRLRVPSELAGRLRPYGVDLAAIREQRIADANPMLAGDGPLLTDDYAPVEFLDLLPTR